MNTNPKGWSPEWIESDEGKEAIKEIVRPLRDQLIQELQAIANKTMEVVTKKILEAYSTCREMAPTILKDFDLNPNPDSFKNFVLDDLEKLCKTIKPQNNSEKLNGFIDSFTEQIDSITEQIIMDERLRAYGEWRKRQHYKSEKWHDLYDELKNEKYIDTTIEVFNSVMEYKHLPGGIDKIQWLKAKKDAVCFADAFNFKMKQLNECFRSIENTMFNDNNRSYSVKQPLPDIIKKYTDLIQA